eukprot:scaffold7676_cov258-Pinguiococcus_pyrenoidosus.AAC.12
MRGESEEIFLARLVVPSWESLCHERHGDGSSETPRSGRGPQEGYPVGAVQHATEAPSPADGTASLLGAPVAPCQVYSVAPFASNLLGSTARLCVWESWERTPVPKRAGKEGEASKHVQAGCGGKPCSSNEGGNACCAK